MQFLKKPIPVWAFMILTIVVAVELCLIASTYTNTITSAKTQAPQMNMETAMAETWHQQTQVAVNLPPTQPSNNYAAPTTQPITQPQPGEPGTSRENPIPYGVEKNFGSMSFAITNVLRPADQIVESGNVYNSKPESDQEYLMVEAKTSCLKESSEKCAFSPYDFKMVGADGNVITTQFIVSGVPGQFEQGETFGGSSKAGRLFFIVPKGDPKVVLFYEPLFFGTPTFFSVN